jgi:sarcosine oxidase gamma subunit
MSDASSTGRLLVRTQHRLEPDASRTLCRLFVPGQETLIRGGSRAMAVIDRVLELSEQEVDIALTRTLTRFSGRHRELAQALEQNFGLVAHRLGAETSIGKSRCQLIGAYFAQEYALEAAALFNPSLWRILTRQAVRPGKSGSS